MIERIDVGTNRIDIHIRLTRLGALLDVAAALLSNATDADPDPVCPGKAAPLRAGNPDARAARSVCHSETRHAVDQAADPGAPLQCRPRFPAEENLNSQTVSTLRGLAQKLRAGRVGTLRR